MKRRFAQMKQWVRQRMVPVFDGRRGDAESNGSLREIWLGGLVNPGALFTALKHEKAVLAKCSDEDVTLTCSVSRSMTSEQFAAEEEGGILVRSLYLQGATWDTEDNAIKESE